MLVSELCHVGSTDLDSDLRLASRQRHNVCFFWYHRTFHGKLSYSQQKSVLKTMMLARSLKQHSIPNGHGSFVKRVSKELFLILPKDTIKNEWKAKTGNGAGEDSCLKTAWNCTLTSVFLPRLRYTSEFDRLKTIFCFRKVTCFS